MKYIHNLLCLIAAVLLFRLAELAGISNHLAMFLLGTFFYFITRQPKKIARNLPWLYKKSHYNLNYLTISITCLIIGVLNALLGLASRFQFDLIVVIIFALTIIIFSFVELYCWVKIFSHPPQWSDWALYMVGYPLAEVIVMAIIASFLIF